MLVLNALMDEYMKLRMPLAGANLPRDFFLALASSASLITLPYSLLELISPPVRAVINA